MDDEFIRPSGGALAFNEKVPSWVPTDGRCNQKVERLWQDRRFLKVSLVRCMCDKKPKLSFYKVLIARPN